MDPDAPLVGQLQVSTTIRAMPPGPLYRLWSRFYGLLPPDVRRQYGLSWDPARALALHGGAEYVKRIVVPLLPRRVRLAPSARTA